MFCQKCGKEIKDGSKFCKYCGAELKIENPKKPNTSDGNTNKIIIGALIGVIVVLAVIFCVFGLGLLNGNEGSNPVNVGDASLNKDPVSLNSFPVSRASELAQAVKDSNGAFPVKFESLSLSKAQCLYILTKAVYEIGSGHPNAAIKVGNPEYAPNPSGRDSSQTISSLSYVDMCKRFSNWIETNREVPNYIGIYTSGVPDVSPSRMLDIVVNILLQYENTGALPNSVRI